MIIWCVEWKACIKPDVGIFPHQWIVLEPLIKQSILNDQWLGIQNGVGTEGNIPLCLLLVTSNPRFKPLPTLTHQGDQSDRSMADHGRHAGDVVVTLFWLGAQNSVFTERAESLSFVAWLRRSSHRPSGRHSHRGNPVSIWDAIKNLEC